MSFFNKIRAALGRPTAETKVVSPAAHVTSQSMRSQPPARSRMTALAVRNDTERSPAWGKKAPDGPAAVAPASGPALTSILESTLPPAPEKGIRQPGLFDPGREHPVARLKVLELMYGRPELFEVTKRNYLRLHQKPADPREGTRTRQQWNRMTKQFIEKVVKPVLGDDLQGLSPDLVRSIMFHEIGARVTDEMLDAKYPDRHTWQETIRKANEDRAEAERAIEAIKAGARSAYRDDMTPLEYEAFCASALRARGWQTELTKASGDQGVDIIAKKSMTTVVFQVKKYSSPVGNAAVQEVHSGKAFYGAKHAAVVSNVPYTTSAQELARKAGVALLHHDDLANFMPL